MFIFGCETLKYKLGHSVSPHPLGCFLCHVPESVVYAEALRSGQSRQKIPPAFSHPPLHQVQSHIPELHLLVTPSEGNFRPPSLSSKKSCRKHLWTRAWGFCCIFFKAAWGDAVDVLFSFNRQNWQLVWRVCLWFWQRVEESYNRCFWFGTRSDRVLPKLPLTDGCRTPGHEVEKRKIISALREKLNK